MSPNLFDTLLEPVFILDENKVITYCNETAAQLLDSNPRKIIRSKLSFINSFSFSENLDFLDSIKTIKEPSPYKEVSFSTASHHEGKAQITLQPFTNDSWILFFRDVTLEERLQKKYRAELEQKEDVIEDLKKAQGQLEVYSKNLEHLVDERTREIVSLNKMMKALLDSLNQGFFIFYKDGSCSPIYSKACLDILETDPSDKTIWEVLNLKSEKVQGFQNWMQTLFSEMLPFEDLAPLGPVTRPHSQNKNISLQYFPIRNAETQIEAVVCVATDISDLVAAQKQAEMDRAKAESILKMVQHKKQIELFFNETKKDFKKILEVTNSSHFTEHAEEILRFLHTLKGGAASFSYINLKEKCHQAESYFVENKDTFSSKNKSDFKTQLLEIQQSFTSSVKDYENMFGKISSVKTIDIALADFDMLLEKASSTLLKSEFTEKYLCEPVIDHISHYEQIISQTALSLNKKIKPLEISGADVKIPKQRFDSLFQVLIHALRNSVDHGIEDSEKRLQQGKSAEGQITFSVHKSSSHLKIVLKDDGKGIDPEKIRKKLLQAQSPLANQSNEEIIYRIFDPQFSTKQEVTEISGRGIGMDAILSEINHLKGTIKINTKIHQFTEFVIEVPLHAADEKESQKAA